MTVATIIETGYWCHYEGVYYTDVDEHMTEAQWRVNELGSLGHFGYECPGYEETTVVAIVAAEEET